MSIKHIWKPVLPLIIVIDMPKSFEHLLIDFEAVQFFNVFFGPSEWFWSLMHGLPRILFYVPLTASILRIEPIDKVSKVSRCSLILFFFSKSLKPFWIWHNERIVVAEKFRCYWIRTSSLLLCKERRNLRIVIFYQLQSEYE